MDDKAVYTYIPKIINYYLNEDPILKNIKTYQLSNRDDGYVVKISIMVAKKTDGSGGYGMLMVQVPQRRKIQDYIKKIKAKPNNFIANLL